MKHDNFEQMMLCKIDIDIFGWGVANKETKNIMPDSWNGKINILVLSFKLLKRIHPKDREK